MPKDQRTLYYVMDKETFIAFYNDHTGRETAKHFGIAYSTVSKYARKWSIPRRSFKYKEITDVLTGRQLEILNGSMLGDGCLEKTETQSSNSRFVEKHGIEQIEYLEWKCKELKPFSSNLSKGQEIKKGKLHKFCQFKTYRHPYFTELESLWYQDRIKRVPDDIYLTPLTLAVWFLDDGYNCCNKNITIYTNGFCLEEVKKLVSKLQAIGIKNCHERQSQVSRGCKPEIYIGKSSLVDFLDIIKPYVAIDCMRYKFEGAKNDPD